MASKRFEMTTGSASKFWEIRQTGKRVFVVYGRIGTDGQAREKTLASPALAKEHAERLIAEKVKKGYRPVKKTTAKKSVAKKTSAKKSVAKKTTAKKSVAKKTTVSPVTAGPAKLSFFSEDGAMRYEAGYPHMRILVEDHPDDQERFSKNLDRIIGSIDPHYHIEWPLKIARAFVREMGRVGRLGNALKEKKRTEPSVEPVTAEEARKLIAHLLKPAMNYRFHVHDHVLLLEAMVGADVICDAILSGYEKMPAKNWSNSNRHDEIYIAEEFGYILGRASPTVRKQSEARVRKLQKKRVKDDCSVSEWLQVSLGGFDQVRAIPWTQDGTIYRFQYTAFVEDEPARVIAGLRDKAGPYEVDARFIYLGGEPVLEYFLGAARRLPKHRFAQFVEECAPIRSEFVVGLYLLLWNKKALKERIGAWFTDHEKFTNPILRQACGDPGFAARITGYLWGKMTDKKRAKLIDKHGLTMSEIAQEVFTALEADGLGAEAASQAEDPEKRYDELTARIAKKLRKALGDEEAEDLVMAEAREGYAEIQSDQGLEPEEHIVHFFAADGGGNRAPAFSLVKKADQKTLDRWCERLWD